MPQQTAEAPPLPADAHLAGQAALVSLIPALLREAWPLLDLHNLKDTLPQFVAAVRAIVQRYGQASSAAALTYYQAERVAAKVPGRVALKMAPTPADSVIESAVQWATTNLYGPTTTPSEWQALQQDALERLDGMVSQLVLDQSRDTIIGAVQQDKYARAWVRVTEPGACSFCLMLAMRGAVYKDQRSAGKGSNDFIRQNGKAFAAHYLTPSDFKVHDHCRCHAEPVFGIFEPSAQAREDMALWKKVVTDQHRSGNDARNAFRQALEGRPVRGMTGKTAAKPKAVIGKSSMDRPQVEFLLAQAQRMKDSPWRTKQIARLQALLKGSPRG